MAKIYKITNDVNNKIYIGQTSFSIEKRFKEHCKDSQRITKEHRPLYAAMRKYGIEHFAIELLEETNSPNEREMYWIAVLKPQYNASLGGEGKLLYNHQAILNRLLEYPYPKQVAREFGCCVDIVYDIAHANNIVIKHAGQDGTSNSNVKPKKAVVAYTKTGIKVAEFESTAEAARWCVDNKFASCLNSGVRAHIAEVANGKRKSAYKHIWKYVSSGLS